VDRTKRAFTSVKNSVKGVNKSYDSMRQKSDKTTAAMRKHLRRVETGMNKLSSRSKSIGRNMSTSLTLPIVGIGVASLRAAGNFEAGMKRVEALTKATGSQLEKLKQQALDLGRTTAFSATQAAGAQGLLAQAGFAQDEIVAALPATLDLAAAGQLELAEATSITADVLRGYNKDAAQAPHIADLLAAASTRANQTVLDIGEAMKFAAGTAASLGRPIEETTAAISLLADRGLKGSLGGTALARALSRLADPSSTANKGLTKLGISARDAEGNVKPLADIIDELNAKGVDAGEAIGIFGDRAGKAIVALQLAGGQALRDFTKGLGDVGGEAKRVAEKQLEGLNGQLIKLKSAAEGLLIAIAQSGLLQAVTRLAEKATGLAQRLAETNPKLLRMVTIVAGIAAAIGPAIFAFGLLAQGAAALVSLAQTFLTLAGGAAAAKASLLAFSGPLAAVIAGAALLVNAWRTGSETWRRVIVENFGAVAKNIGRVLLPVFDVLKTIIGTIINVATALVQVFLVDLSLAWKGLSSIFSTILGPVLEAIADFLGKWIPRAAGFLINALGEVRKFFLDLAAGIIDGIAGLLEKIEGLPFGIGSAAAAAAKSMRGLAVDIRVAGVAIEEMTDNIGNWREEIDAAGRSSEDALGFAAALAAALERVKPDGLEAAGLAATEIYEALPDTVDFPLPEPSQLSGFYRIWNQVGDTVNSTFNRVVTAGFNAAITKGRNAAEAIKTAFLSALAQIGAAITREIFKRLALNVVASALGAPGALGGGDSSLTLGATVQPPGQTPGGQTIGQQIIINEQSFLPRTTVERARAGRTVNQVGVQYDRFVLGAG